jgi:hypothetical protein
MRMCVVVQAVSKGLSFRKAALAYTYMRVTLDLTPQMVKLDRTSRNDNN